MSNQLEVSEVKEGMYIEYLGESFAFGGKYQTVTAESTYKNIEDCPEEDKGKLMIVEFMNDETPMFFKIDLLNASEWRLVK